MKKTKLPHEVSHQYVQIKIITPVHVGVSKDNHWFKKADYYWDRGAGKLYRYNLLECLKQENNPNLIDDVCNDLTNDGKNEIRNPYLDKLKQSALVFDLKFDPGRNGIKPQIRTGLGIPYIPGSSIKGALQGIFYNYLFKRVSKLNQKEIIDKFSVNRSERGATVTVKEKEKEKEWLKSIKENTILGSFNTSISRYIRITDASFATQDTVLSVNQIRTLNHQGGNDPVPEWKTNNFNTVYETLAIGKQSVLRLTIARELYKLLKQKANLKDIEIPKEAESLLNLDNSALFEIINDYTLRYVNKEIRFMEKWENLNGDDESIKQHFADIKSQVEKLKSEGNKACIFRMASGVGFHSITGDWQSPEDHITRRVDNNKQVFNKTRRFAKVGKDFVPMGFVKISMIDEQEAKALMAEQENSRSIAIQEAKEEIPLKPEIPDKITKVTKNSRDIPAKVIDGTKGKLKVELWANGYEGKKYNLSGYSSELVKDSFIYVEYPDEKNKSVKYQKLY